MSEFFFFWQKRLLTKPFCKEPHEMNNSRCIFQTETQLLSSISCTIYSVLDFYYYIPYNTTMYILHYILLCSDAIEMFNLTNVQFEHLVNVAFLFLKSTVPRMKADKVSGKYVGQA